MKHDANTLLNIIKLGGQIDLLQDEIDRTEKLLNKIDAEIARLETDEPDSEMLEVHAKNYNYLNLKQIRLKLEQNKVEHDLLIIQESLALAE